MPVPAKFDMSQVHPFEGEDNAPSSGEGGAPQKFDTSQIQPINPTFTPSHQMKSDDRGSVTRFLDDLDADLRQGGSRTFIGRALGHAQGRGDKGYSGMESGTSKDAAEFMGSIPLGLVKTASGLAEAHDHPVKGSLKALSGLLETATIPGSFVGGPTAELAIEAIPSKEAAGKILASVANDANNLPVTLSRSAPEIDRVREMVEAGSPSSKAITRILARTKNPSLKQFFQKGPVRPMTYREARDFYSNLTSLSAEDVSTLNAPMRRQIGQLVAALKQDIGDTAAQVGRAADYYSGLKEYAQASKLNRFVDNAKELLAKPAARWLEGLGLGAGGYEAYRRLSK
jgi:hypothetical protein